MYQFHLISSHLISFDSSSLILAVTSFPHTFSLIQFTVHRTPPKMHSPLVLLSLLSIFSNSLIHANPLPLPVPQPDTSAVNATAACTDIRIITARASTESPGEGIIGALASAIQLGTSKSVTRTSVSYPAVLAPYAPSVASGVAAMKADIIAAVDACPSQKIVLLGYSQGGEFLPMHLLYRF